MLINKRCTVCHDDIEAADRVTCDICANELHGRCAEFETTYECSRCADEPWLGTIEF